MRVRGLSQKLALSVTSVLLTLLFLEIVVRFWFPQSLAVPWQDEVNGITAPRPNVHGRHSIPNTFDVTISFNSQRFRGLREFSPHPADGFLRIATLGDSFTFGYGANDDDTYPAALEVRLKPKNVEVINAANAGTGTGEQALWYESWVKNFHPNVVILTVTSNDVDDDGARRLFVLDSQGKAQPRQREIASVETPRRVVNSIPGYSFIAEHSQLYGLVRNAASSLLARHDVNMSEKTRFQSEGLLLLSSEIGWLNDRAHEHNSRLVVVFIPSRESIYPSSASWAEDVRWKSAAIVKTLSSSSEKHAVPFLDITPELKLRSSDRLYYDGLDTHPTPAGYYAFAAIIATFLSKQNLLSLQDYRSG